MPRARFRLSLIGRFELTGPDGAIDLPSKKLAGLLAYLACSAPVPQLAKSWQLCCGARISKSRHAKTFARPFSGCAGCWVPIP